MEGHEEQDSNSTSESTSHTIFQTGVAGLVLGSIIALVAISLSSLIFSGKVAAFLPTGMVLCLLSATIITGLVAWSSSCVGMIAFPQERVAPVIATMATVLTSQLEGMPPEALFLNIILIMSLSAVFTGLLLYLFGWFQLGAWVRFIPYPVIGGFLAGTGWLLVKGSVGVMSSGSLFSTKAALGFGFGMGIVLIERKIRHRFILPISVLVGLGLFYLVVWSMGIPWQSLLSEQYLLGPFPETDGLTWLLDDALKAGQWISLLNQWGTVLTVALIALVSVLLNSSAMELIYREDIDLNRELRVAGLGNMAIALCGGLVGFHSLSISRLAHSLRTRNRWVGIIAALFCLFLCLAGAQFLMYLPRFVIGGLLFYLGMHFLLEWLFEAFFKLDGTDFTVVVFIMGVIAFFGYIWGVLAGIGICIVLFILTYSRINIIGHQLSGKHHQSHVDRPRKHMQILDEHADTLIIFKLRGFLFFGTANSLYERVKHISGEAPFHFLVLDFKRVTGMDSSAVLSLSKLLLLAERKQFTIVFAGISKSLEGQINLQHLGTERARLELFHNLDFGLEWCENQILQKAGVSEEEYDAISPKEQLRPIFTDEAEIDRFLSFFTARTMKRGETILHQGTRSDDLLLIDQGQVTVCLHADGKTLRFRKMYSGTIVGEMGVILNRERSADVVADTDGRILRLTRESMETMCRQDPRLGVKLHALLNLILAERLENLNHSYRILSQ